MLFSDKTIAKQINSKFEPVCESLRPVPKVTIDFGNGKVIKRTLHGNIATYICTADGTVFDVLPGIYSPIDYAAQLDALCDAENRTRELDRGAVYNYLREYHRQALAAEAAQQSPYSPVAYPADESKSELTINGLQVHLDDALLNKDTRINQAERRAKIHTYLSARVHRPEQMHKWLYREVLHADLDDPYLGLKPILDETYPWTEEDAK